MKLSIKIIYLYIALLTGMFLWIAGLVRISDIAIKHFFFKGADDYSYYEPKYIETSTDSKISTEEAKRQRDEMEKIQRENNLRQRQRNASSSVSMILVGLPLYFVHWKMIKKEKE